MHSHCKDYVQDEIGQGNGPARSGGAIVFEKFMSAL